MCVFFTGAYRSECSCDQKSAERAQKQSVRIIDFNVRRLKNVYPVGLTANHRPTNPTKVSQRSFNARHTLQGFSTLPQPAPTSTCSSLVTRVDVVKLSICDIGTKVEGNAPRAEIEPIGSIGGQAKVDMYILNPSREVEICGMDNEVMKKISFTYDKGMIKPCVE